MCKLRYHRGTGFCSQRDWRSDVSRLSAASHGRERPEASAGASDDRAGWQEEGKERETVREDVRE